VIGEIVQSSDNRWIFIRYYRNCWI